METAALEEASAVFVDRKRHLWLLGLVVPLLPFIAAGLVWTTGRGFFWWFGPLFVYGVIPFCELAIGTDADSFRSAWDIERTRLARMGRSSWSWQSDIVQAFALTAALYGALIAAFGPVMVPFLAIQAIVGFSELEVVNYLEHYGLLRQKLADGRYERATPAHSWNSNQLVTNVFLYQLQRHSDHHAHPTRRYQALRHFHESPQLPSGYASMVVLALVPPLWRRVMDWRVRAHYD